MPSKSLDIWKSRRRRELDEIEGAHQAVGGKGPGRRHATQQLNRAYAVLLASHFQGFCRDLHSECVDIVVRGVAPAVLRPIVGTGLTAGRQLGRANATPGAVGSDFGRLGVRFWDEVHALDGKNVRRQKSLVELNDWRNAIAHHDFGDLAKLGGNSILRLDRVKKWRIACNALARSFDEVMRQYLTKLNGSSLW